MKWCHPLAWPSCLKTVHEPPRTTERQTLLRIRMETICSPLLTMLIVNIESMPVEQASRPRWNSPASTHCSLLSPTLLGSPWSPRAFHTVVAVGRTVWERSSGVSHNRASSNHQSRRPPSAISKKSVLCCVGLWILLRMPWDSDSCLPFVTVH